MESKQPEESLLDWLTDDEWTQLFSEMVTNHFEYQDPRLERKAIFYPKTENDRAIEKRLHLAELSMVQITKKFGMNPIAFPFRCPQCHTRPVRVSKNALRAWLCKCSAMTFPLGAEYKEPRSSKDWQGVVDLMNRAKALRSASQQQPEPQSN